MIELLQQGIAAAQAGKREDARALLMRVVEEDERNEQAWLWLAGVVDDPEDVRTCLHNVLDLNPANQQAQKGLAWIEAQHGPATAPEPVAAPPLAETAPPTPAPIVTASTTEPTTKLAADLALPTPAGPVAPSTASVAEPIAEPSEALCPYCGAPTQLTQSACTHCRGNLMIRTAARETSSVPLKIVGGLWVANGVLSIIGSLLGAIGVMVLYQQVLGTVTRINPKASVPFPTGIMIPLAISLLLGIGIIQIAKALLRRERWAFYIIVGLSALGFIGMLLNIARVGGLVSELAAPGAIALPRAQQGMLASIIAAAGTVALCTLAFQALYLVLLGLSYRDFFGPMLRLSPVVESAEHVQHYNNGIAYKNRGMWYIATQEWEAALKKSPLDTSYLLALGLAYAQLKRLYPQATASHQSTRDYLVSRKADLYAVAPELEALNLF